MRPKIPAERERPAPRLTIKRGLKRRARKRKLIIDREMKAVLEQLVNQSDCEYVFTSPLDPSKPLGPWVLEEQMAQLRKKIKTHADAGPACAASYLSHRGRGVHRSVYIAVR